MGEKAEARRIGLGREEGVYQGCIYVSGSVSQEKGHRGTVWKYILLDKPAPLAIICACVLLGLDMLGQVP